MPPTARPIASLLKFLEHQNLALLPNSTSMNPVPYVHTGRSRIALRETGEVFSLVPPNSKAHNVIMGRTWVDCYGDLSLVNASTGAACSLYFTPCGWFSYGRYEVSLTLIWAFRDQK